MGLLDILLLSLSEHFEKKKRFERNYIFFPLGEKEEENPTLENTTQIRQWSVEKSEGVKQNRSV